ncbi:MAG: acyltransferase [Lachnospiraceae bacterium]|nr:acyltransferase [Lachnospiraceae bacterium]
MKERNCSLDMFRMFAALGVVLCHCQVFIDVDTNLYMAIAEFLPRFTVPFFFGVAGYYYIGSLLHGKKVFGKQMKGLLTVYIAWTLIYYLASFAINVVLGDADIWDFLVERVVNFFTIGSYTHMWYMISLIYAVILVTLAHKLGGEKGIKLMTILGIVMTVICALGCMYYPLGSQIPVLKEFLDYEHFMVVTYWFGMGVPYFTLGYFVIKEENSPKPWSDKIVWIMWAISLVAYLAEIWTVPFATDYFERNQVGVTVYFFTIMNLIVLLRNPLPKYQKQAKVCKYLSSFVYFLHPLVILVLKTMCNMVSISLHSAVLYVLVLVICCLSGYVLMKSNWKIKNYLM